MMTGNGDKTIQTITIYPPNLAPINGEMPFSLKQVRKRLRGLQIKHWPEEGKGGNCFPPLNFSMSGNYLENYKT